MKARFTKNPNRDFIVLEPQTDQEADDLQRWNNSVLSTQFQHPIPGTKFLGELLLCRES